MGLPNNLGKLSNMITSTGSAVGVNTTTPFGIFNVVAGTNKSLIIQDSGIADTIEIAAYSTSGGTRAIAMNGSVLTFGTGTAGGGSATPRLTINTAGNVGIGTSSPATYTIAPQLVVDSGASGGGLTIKTGTTSSTTNYGGVFFADGTTGSEQYRGFIQYNHNFNTLSDTLILGTAGTERMYITSSGNVGIGTSSPASLLNIVTSNTTAYDSTVDDGQAADGSTITIRNSSTVNNTFAQINMQVSGDSGRALGRIVTIRTASATSDMAFVTESDNTKSEKMRITSGGQLIIGNTASIYTNTKLAVCQTSANMTAEIRSAWAGDIATSALIVVKYDNNNSSSQVFQRFVIGNGDLTSGQINANGANQVAFGSWSDIRLKENVENLQSQLDNIMALRPVEFDYKDGSGHQIGFIAQEMQEVYADAVGEDSEGFLTITGWSKTEARLVKALQEAVNKIEELNAKVTALENK